LGGLHLYSKIYTPYTSIKKLKNNPIMEFIKIVLKEDKGNRKINYALILFYCNLIFKGGN